MSQSPREPAQSGDLTQSRDILRLAVPAFLALVAEPLFLLADSAIIGHLGTAQLAGLGVASATLITAANIFVFLAYGTTSIVARQIGAGSERGALEAGIDGTWLAVGLGAVTSVAVALAAEPLCRVFGASDDAIGYAATYLRISALGIPAMLVALAATGVLRGLQDTRTPLVASVAGFSVQRRPQPALRLRVRLGHSGIRVGHRHRADRHGGRPRHRHGPTRPARRRDPARAPGTRAAGRAHRHTPARAHPRAARDPAPHHLGRGRPRRRAAGLAPGGRDGVELPGVRPRRARHRRAGAHRQGPRGRRRRRRPGRDDHDDPVGRLGWRGPGAARPGRALAAARALHDRPRGAVGALGGADRGRARTAARRLRLRRRRRAHRGRRRAVAGQGDGRDPGALPAAGRLGAREQRRPPGPGRSHGRSPSCGSSSRRSWRSAPASSGGGSAATPGP